MLGLLLGATGLWAADKAETTSAPQPASSPTPPARLEGFTLSDQFEREHTVGLPRERPLLLTVSDRRAAPQVAGWVNPLNTRFGGQLDYVGVADVRGVPGWLRGRVRRGFRETYAHPVLLDWEGQVCRAVEVERGRVAVWLVAPDGAVKFRGAGPADAESLDRLTRAAESLLSAPPDAAERSAAGEN